MSYPKNKHQFPWKLLPCPLWMGLYKPWVFIIIVKSTGNQGLSHGICVVVQSVLVGPNRMYRWDGSKLRHASPAPAGSHRLCSLAFMTLVKKITGQQVMICLTGWWFQPSWNILVSWDDYSQYIYMYNIYGKNVPNHQPVICWVILLWKFLCDIIYQCCFIKHG